ncbi:MAG: FtsW/RodA/SpoVE family cell cycle protein, partial [Candidatus Hydrothermia bacterium]
MRRFLPFFFALGIIAMSMVELFSIGVNHGLRQLIWLGLSGMAFLFFYKGISPITLKRGAEIIYWVSIALLIAVLILGGPGAKRWFSFGLMKFQPSELAKLALLLVLSKTLDTKAPSTTKVMAAVGYSLPAFILIFFEPDLATAGAMIAILTTLLVVSGVNVSLLLLLYTPILAAASSFWLWSFIALVLGIFAASRLMKRQWGYTLAITTLVIGVGLLTPLVWKGVLKEYQRKRVIAFFAPKAQSTAAGW